MVAFYEGIYRLQCVGARIKKKKQKQNHFLKNKYKHRNNKVWL